jgi:uncharacterized protein YjbJ (UPF0337 family)
MSRDVIQSLWSRLHGKLRSQWPKLTYEDATHGDGDRAYLIAKLKERYRFDADEALRQVAEFETHIQ